MQFLVSSTSTSILIYDLGLDIEHPTVDRDLSLEFTPEEISESVDLTNAINSGLLTLKLENIDHGLYQVGAGQYNQYSLLQQNLSPDLQEEVVTESELLSGFGQVVVKEGIFPVVISSTTSGTNLLVSTSSFFKDWYVSAGDQIYISQSAGNDGYKTVDYVIDQTKLVTVQPLLTTLSSGVFWVLNPPGSTRVGVRTDHLSNITGSNLQEALESIDSAISGSGLTEPAHEALNTLVHQLSESFDGYQTRNSDGILQQVIFRQPGNGPIIKKAYSFNSDTDGMITGYVIEGYNNSGLLLDTLDVTVDPTTGRHTVIKL